MRGTSSILFTSRHSTAITSGGRFGGPIRKNKTFLFGVYEGLKQIQGFTVGDVVPAAGCHGPAGAIIWNGVGNTTGRTRSPTPCPHWGRIPAGRRDQLGHRSAR